MQPNRVSYGLNPDMYRHFVAPGLASNYLQIAKAIHRHQKLPIARPGLECKSPTVVMNSLKFLLSALFVRSVRKFEECVKLIKACTMHRQSHWNHSPDV